MCVLYLQVLQLQYLIERVCVCSQERAGVKMILIQDASQGPDMDKPLRIIGEPYKVQVHWLPMGHLCRVSPKYFNIYL